MGLMDDSRREIVLYRIERALIALEQAKACLSMHFLEVTANRLYYAAYYSVTALLIASGIPSHSHDGCITQFGLYFVKTGILPKDMGKLLRQLFTMRLTGDYSDRFDLTEEEISPKISAVENFVMIVTNLAKQKLNE